MKPSIFIFAMSFILMSCFPETRIHSVATIERISDNKLAASPFHLDGKYAGWGIIVRSLLTLGDEASNVVVTIAVINESTHPIEVNGRLTNGDRGGYVQRELLTHERVVIYKGPLGVFLISWSVTVSSPHGQDVDIAIELESNIKNNLPNINVSAESNDGS
jgi:hypothetical protein